MGKWMKEIAASADHMIDNAHVSDADLARLSGGVVVDSEERRALLLHVNRCPDCFAALDETVAALEAEAAEGIRRTGGRFRRMTALAASFVMVALAGVLYLRLQQGASPGVLMTTLTLDAELRDILLESDAVRWDKGDRVDRLTNLLVARGLSVQGLNRVEMDKPYYPTRSIVPPDESLIVRIEKGVARLTVIRNPPE